LAKRNGKRNRSIGPKRDSRPASSTKRSLLPALKRSLAGWAGALLIVIFGVVALRFYLRPGPLISPSRKLSLASSAKRPTFIGSSGCGGCHQAEFKLWRGSHHQLAMQPVSNSTVLGNFNNAKITINGVTSTFFHRASKFMVRTDGSDGELHEYEIKYTFGVYPLQQYLIPMAGGRLQALGLAWDSRPRDRGGQHWFFLYPGQNVSSSDPLHWTAIDQTWNYQCADCHSTNVRKNYDLATRAYHTSYSEIDVACEACHGPGSNHREWAKRHGEWKSSGADHGLTIALDEREGASWAIDPASGNPRRSVPRESDREIQMCARCHSRRGGIHEDYVHGQPVGDDYRVALLDQDLYFPDGQIKGEAYEYGSFIQSRMYHEGVTCSDCHEPHGLKLRADGNSICLQCHFAPKYNSSKHHFHQMGSAGAQCVECHMPTRTYMLVDPRRDHSLRVPRPDLSVKLGVPNACTNCHTDKSAQWASESVDKWYGRVTHGFQRFADVIDAGETGAPGAPQSLAGLVNDHEQPSIARATALSMLSAYDPPPSDSAIHAGATDESAMVRRATARALANSDPSDDLAILVPLLGDQVRAVRVETAEVLGGLKGSTLTAVSAGTLPADAVASFERATDEYIAAQELNADRPEAHVNLGALYAKQTHFTEAEAEFRTALSLDPAFAPAAIDLADLYRARNQDRAEEALLQRAISRSPNEASLQHAFGLLLVRQKWNVEALNYLASAARIEPDNSRYAYVYAVALHEAGDSSAAIETLQASLKSHPYDRDALAALVDFREQAGQFAQALDDARRLEQLEPADPTVQRTIKTLNDRHH
jgi:Flp pilus assembly protein TadD